VSNPTIRSLFHTLVVVGASVSACAGRSTREQAEPEAGGSAGAGGSTTGVGGTAIGTGGGVAAGAGGTAGSRPKPSPADCGFPAQWSCTSYSTLEGCSCDPTAPASKDECTSPFDFHCAELWNADGVDCSCVPGSLTPDHCGRPEQFSCLHSGDYFFGCDCDPNAPLEPADCDDEWCTRFTCMSESPRYGCECKHLACIK